MPNAQSVHCTDTGILLHIDTPFSLILKVRQRKTLRLPEVRLRFAVETLDCTGTVAAAAGDIDYLSCFCILSWINGLPGEDVHAALQLCNGYYHSASSSAREVAAGLQALSSLFDQAKACFPPATTSGGQPDPRQHQQQRLSALAEFHSKAARASASSSASPPFSLRERVAVLSDTGPAQQQRMRIYRKPPRVFVGRDDIIQVS